MTKIKVDFPKDPNFAYENYKSFHYCELGLFSGTYGAAITKCFEDQDGCLFISHDEYCSPVNFCPQCGYEAKVKT